MTRSLALLCTLVMLAILIASDARAEGGVVAIVEGRPRGVAPAATAAVTRQVYGTAARLGYRAVPERATQEVSTRLSATPTPAELAWLGGQVGADHTLHAEVGADGGRYLVTLSVAHAAGAPPYIARATASAQDLESVTESLVRSALPPLAPPAAPREAHEARAPASSPASRIAVQTEGAIGLTRPGFYNHLLGARYDHGVTPELAVGGYLGYVNLKGKEGRAHNLLPYFHLEYRLRGARAGAVQFPLRMGSGYLARNGPFLRLSAGLSIPVGETTRLGFDLLAPTFWVVRSSTVVSMNLAAEISFAL